MERVVDFERHGEFGDVVAKTTHTFCGTFSISIASPVRWIRHRSTFENHVRSTDRDWSLCYVDDNGKENIKGFLQDS